MSVVYVCCCVLWLLVLLEFTNILSPSVELSLQLPAQIDNQREMLL